MKYLIIPLWLILFPAFELCAQNEVVRERFSLQGIQEVGFTVNIQGSESVTQDTTLTPTKIRQQSINKLVNANLRYVSDEEVESSADVPFLHMHINTLQLDNGLVPFSIHLKLYQPVKLILNRDLQTSASTWETGMVGLVSYDQLQTIPDAADNVLSQFIHEYDQANR